MSLIYFQLPDNIPSIGFKFCSVVDVGATQHRYKTKVLKRRQMKTDFSANVRRGSWPEIVFVSLLMVPRGT